DEKKIEILHSGINCERFCYQPRELKNGEAVKIFTVARLVEMKGVAYGIKAVAQLIKSGRKICYKIAGDGALREELERLIKELGMENSIQLLGWKGHKELPGLMDDTHILLTPSVTAANGEQEGIPNVVKEAMAMGIPVVGTLHSGIPELVENGVSGYLAPERDSQMLAECLAKLIDQSDRWPEIGKAGRQKVELEFDMNKLNDKLVELYRSVAT
ncbi:MAG TPA: colanic acid biosynthesis glycosyltransferase WcaL, partial [Gammaproteobacteria bacterium]|nr:colanic acid biosynthesis glycosyltransferase WcaL [Gammaproteobacteria bacterium]